MLVLLSRARAFTIRAPARARPARAATAAWAAAPPPSTDGAASDDGAYAQRALIVGGGFGGLYTALALAALPAAGSAAARSGGDAAAEQTSSKSASTSQRATSGGGSRPAKPSSAAPTSSIPPLPCSEDFVFCAKGQASPLLIGDDHWAWSFLTRVLHTAGVWGGVNFGIIPATSHCGKHGRGEDRRERRFLTCPREPIGGRRWRRW